jgi:hypothetical protein
MSSNDWLEVKKDWVYQRKKTFVFKSWNPRYMVLYSKPCPALALYEQRSDSVAPYAPVLHLELTSNLRIEAYGKNSAGNQHESMMSMASSRHPDDHHSDARRGSITSLVSESRGPKSKKNMEENALVIVRPGSEKQIPLKVSSKGCYVQCYLFFDSWSFLLVQKKRGMIGFLKSKIYLSLS